MLGSAIVLLGKQIPLSSVDGEAPAGYFGASSEKTEHEEAEKVTFEGKVTEETHENEEALMDERDSVEMDTENIQPAIKSENGEIGETEQCDTNLKEKTSKKPDKLLPCPRCKSMDTKFCYYNNYNVNQPRYFCKACQRYWTSGGTMRSMPVGAGRRKNKNSLSAYRHITVSETLQLVGTNEKVLCFGSITSGRSNGEKGLKENLNGLEKMEGQGFPPSRVGHEISDDCSSVSSVTVSDSVEEGVNNSSHKQHFQDLNVSPSSYLPFFPGVSWPYCLPGFPPLSFYHGSYWNPSWFPPQPSSPSSPKDSPTLGKHSRDSDVSETYNSNNRELNKQRQGSVLVPKTLRIGNPDDAAKSSIWATLGIKNESFRPSDMFKDFQSKGVEKACLAERSSVLQANPAALTRYLTFHETA